MSYASVAAQNAPPPSQQPRPDPALLTTEPPSADNIANDAAKINIVSPDFKENPATITSTQRPQTSNPGPPLGAPTKSPSDDQSKKRKETKEVSESILGVLRFYLTRPAVAGGLLGVVNVGIISGVGYLAYTKPRLRQDLRVVSGTVAGIFAIVGAEGYLLKSYATGVGSEKSRVASDDARLLDLTKKHLLRPGVLGGFVGLVNAAVLGAVGFLMYSNWDKRWDTRVVSSASVGLLTLWASEGYLAERYHEKRR